MLVHKPSDGWKVLAAQCVGCVVAHGVTVVLAYREVGFQWPTPGGVGFTPAGHLDVLISRGAEYLWFGQPVDPGFGRAGSCAG